MTAQDRFARSQKSNDQCSLGVGPREDIRQAQVTEGLGVVEPEEPKASAPQHEAQAVGDGGPECEVELPSRLGFGGLANGSRVKDAVPPVLPFVE